MATNHISLEALTDHIMNSLSDSSSCEESEDKKKQLTTDDPAPVSDCTLQDSACVNIVTWLNLKLQCKQSSFSTSSSHIILTV